MLLVPVCIVLSHSLPLQPHTNMQTDRYIMLCFVRVRACRLQAADSQTPSQPRPPALVPSQISQPPLPPPSSLCGSSNSVARRLPARRQRSSPELLFFFFFATVAKDGAARGCHGAAWAISFPPQSTEMVLFLSDLRLPQTGFSRFRSAGIKLLRCSTASEIHTGSRAVPTSSQTSLQGFFFHHLNCRFSG